MNHSRKDTPRPNPTEQTLLTTTTTGRLLEEYATELLWEMDADGLLIDLSPSWRKVTGYESTSLLGTVFLNLLHPDDLAPFQNALDTALLTKGTLHLPDYRVRYADGSWHWHAATLIAIGQKERAGSDEAVFLVGVARDISDHKRAVQQLRLQTMVLDQIQDLVTITDLEGIITYVNEATARAHQRSREEIIGRSVTIYGADPDQGPTHEEIITKTLEQGNWRGEIVNYDGLGRPLVIDCRTTLIHDADGCPVGMCGIGVDITQGKRFKEQARQGEAALRAILNASPETIFLMEVNGTILAANESLCQRLQTPMESVVGSDIYSYLPPALAAARRQHVQQVVETRQRWHFRDQRNDLIMENYLYPVQEKSGEVRQLAVFAMDITERIRTEEALMHSQALLNVAQQLSRVGGWKWNVKKQVMSWTDETYRIHGFSPGELLESAELIQTSLGCYNAEDRPVLLKAFNRCIEHGQPYDLQLPFTAVDGRRLWIRTMAAPIREGEQIVKVIGNIVDITERKQRENLLLARLRLSETSSALSQKALLQKVLDEAEVLTDSRIGFFHFLETDQRTISLQVWSTNTLRSYCRAEEKELHYSLDAAGVWVDCIRQRQPVIHNDYAALPHRKGMPAGHAPIIRELVVPIFKDKKIVAVFGVGNKAQEYDQRDVELVTTLGDMAWDIVLRKRAEERLAESEANLQEAHKIARIGQWEIDLTTKRFTWSDGVFSLLEIDRESFVPSYEAFLNFVHPEDRALVDRTWKSVHSKTSYEFEHRLLMDDGRIKWVNEIGRTEYDDAGHPLRSIGTVQDITRRKQTETLLLESESQYRRIVDTAREGILVLDRDGLIVYSNQHMAKLLGCSPDEMAGVPIQDFIFSEDLADHLRRMEERRQGKGDLYERRLRHKDGRTIWTIVSATVLLDNQGECKGSFAMFTDITDRKQIEEQLIFALAEKEVLLREVHHRVKNNLAAIIGLMDMQRQILDDPQGRDVLTELSTRIRSMSMVHEKLYRAESMAHIDFHEYIQALVSHLRTSFGARQIICEVDAQGVELPLDLAVPCGLIINELITNALKYAFPDGQPRPGNDTCRIEVHVGHDHGVYTLSVADNGVGLPPGYDWTKAKTLGLVLVRMLGQHQLGGSYVQESLGGTRISLTFTTRNRKP